MARPGLIARLNQGMGSKLTLVSAPAGFGKTTLAADWLPQTGWLFVWLSLDDGDNDPLYPWGMSEEALRLAPIASPSTSRPHNVIQRKPKPLGNSCQYRRTSLTLS